MLANVIKRSWIVRVTSEVYILPELQFQESGVARGVPADDGSRAGAAPSPAAAAEPADSSSGDYTPRADAGETYDAGDVNMGYVGSLDPQAGDFASELLLLPLGSSGRSYGRETRAACRRIVSEMYSRPA